ncbi:ribbon-helix-helix domain-containing protein [Nanoarchaeota archaeon]
MNTRVNINIPEALFEKSQELVKAGFFSNFSELVREGLRRELVEYEDKFVSKDEKKLMNLLKTADKEGVLLEEKEMEKHGLKL